MTVKQLLRQMPSDTMCTLVGDHIPKDKYVEVHANEIRGEVLADTIGSIYVVKDILVMVLTGQQPSSYLRPCPFCGRKRPEMRTPVIGDEYRVMCDMRDGGCGASTRGCLHKEDAAAAWNERSFL